MPSTKTLHSFSQAAVAAAAKQVVRMAGLSTDNELTMVTVTIFLSSTGSLDWSMTEKLFNSGHLISCIINLLDRRYTENPVCNMNPQSPLTPQKLLSNHLKTCVVTWPPTEAIVAHYMPCLGHMLRPAVCHFSERRKERVFNWNNFVVLCSSGLQSPKSASSEAKGIHLSQESVLLSVFHVLLHTMLHKPHYVANNN